MNQGPNRLFAPARCIDIWRMHKTTNHDKMLACCIIDKHSIAPRNSEGPIRNLRLRYRELLAQELDLIFRNHQRQIRAMNGGDFAQGDLII